jgi:hypothetical protein
MQELLSEKLQLLNGTFYIFPLCAATYATSAAMWLGMLRANASASMQTKKKPRQKEKVQVSDTTMLNDARMVETKTFKTCLTAITISAFCLSDL